jgi:phenylacetate-CoA ligase
MHTVGRFIITSLLNKSMPLIRYDVGDRGLLNYGELCNCGRCLPSIVSLEGRSNDLLIAQDGRQVFWINPVFYGLPIREAQVIQQMRGQIVVRYVPAPEFSKEVEKTLFSRLRDRLGELEVVLEPVEQISRSANGKFQAVVSYIH